MRQSQLEHRNEHRTGFEDIGQNCYKDWKQVEARNLRLVARTRAKNKLVYLEKALSYTNYRTYQTRVGVSVSRRALWVGVNYSESNKRLSINPIPCVTFWITFRGGNTPMKFLFAFGAMLCCTSCFGGIVIDNSDPLNVAQIDQYQTTGADMGGLQVTALFADGSSDTATWQATSSNGGKAAGNGWSLAQKGDTFEVGNSRKWKMKSLYDVVGLDLDGLAGGVVFDRLSAFEVSVGSASGRQLMSDDPFDATYSRPVLVAGVQHDPHDLYGKLDIDFAPTRKFAFLQDTDNIASVPEPSALGLLAGLVLYRRRRR